VGSGLSGISGGRVAAEAARKITIVSASGADIAALFRIRRMIEPELIARGAASFSAQRLGELERLIDSIATTATPVGTAVRVHHDFYLHLVSPAATPTDFRALLPLHREVELIFETGTRTLGVHPAEFPDALAAYHKILDAVRTKDPQKILTEMDAHLRRNEGLTMGIATQLNILEG
jgi:DNA-binding GntR family transcriptional regulator